MRYDLRIKGNKAEITCSVTGSLEGTLWFNKNDSECEMISKDLYNRYLKDYFGDYLVPLKYSKTTIKEKKEALKNIFK